MNLGKTVKPKLRDLEALVGNPDAYAVQNENGSWYPIREELSTAVIRRHRAGEITVGTYVVHGDQARTLVFDIDDQGQSPTKAELGGITDILDALDINYGVEDSGGKGRRFHVWVVAEDYLDAGVLYRLGRGVREEAGLPQLETFPKQRESRDLGNLVKLPGGRHAVTGRNNDFLGWVPELNPADRLEEAAEKYPEVSVQSRDASRRGVTWPCVHKIQEGVDEGSRNTALFHFAVMLRMFSLNDRHVEMVVRSTNERFRPPLDDVEVEAVLESSRNSGPLHGQLQGDFCDETCLPASRHPGLYTRPGSLKWAAEGEAVVVLVASRTDDGRTIELEHPDMIQGRATMRARDAKVVSRRGSRPERGKKKERR